MNIDAYFTAGFVIGLLVMFFGTTIVLSIKKKRSYRLDFSDVSLVALSMLGVGLLTWFAWPATLAISAGLAIWFVLEHKDDLRRNVS